MASMKKSSRTFAELTNMYFFISWGSLIALDAGLRYFIHPKCASSTLRWWMWKSFNATTIWNQIYKHRDLRTFTSIREPISRFVSGYNEVSETYNFLEDFEKGFIPKSRVCVRIFQHYFGLEFFKISTFSMASRKISIGRT